LGATTARERRCQVASTNKTAPTPQDKANGSGQKPSAKFRMGRIAATVWENQGENGPWVSTTILRSYKDGDTWKTTASYGADDHPVVEKVAALADAWIFHQQQRQGGEAAQEGNDVPF